MRAKRGFTLIELLIVVAIIAILAAIAVPNFLQAQIRAKVAKVEADFASMAVAMESYRVDNDDYPIAYGGAYFRELAQLTTPVKYMASIPLDPFKPWEVCPKDRDRDGRCFAASDTRHQDGGGYDMIRFTGGTLSQNALYWFFMCVGPDSDEEQGYWPPVWNQAYAIQIRNQTYDVSNGLISSGDIYRFGPSDPRILK